MSEEEMKPSISLLRSSPLAIGVSEDAEDTDEIITSAPLCSRRAGTAVREDEIDFCPERFTESFPPPPILLTPRSEPSSAPPPAIYRVLVACDLSELSEGVLREALGFAHGHMPAELHLVAVVEKVKEHYVLRHDHHRQHLALEVVKSLMTNLIWRVGVAKGSPLEDTMQNVGLHVCVGDPAMEILRLGRELLIDLIVVGCREHEGLERRIWGSISKTVMTHADCSVVLSRPVDFVHGRRTPSIEPPKMWHSEPHHLTMHHYYSGRPAPNVMPHVL
jgi:nucleotide-binding universal stress UspA family protein